jgi:SPP1 family phage portal protein
LDKELFKKCYEDYLVNKIVYEDMYNYYCSESKVMNDYSAMEYQESHKMNLNYLKMLIKEEVAYSIGSPFNYTSKTNDKNSVEMIEYYLYHWNRNHDNELLKNMLIYSTVFELYYTDERKANFNAKILSPRNGYAYVDDFGNILLFMHVYKLKFDEKVYIDVYDDNMIYHYDDEFNEVKSPNIHIFGEIPVSIGIISEEQIKDTLYTDTKDIQNGLSTIASDGVNEITNTRQAILAGKGIQLDEETIKNLKKYRFASLPNDKEASLNWLIKSLNPEYQKLMMEFLKETMYELSFHVSSSDKIQSNVSGLAMRNRLISLESKTKLNNRALTNILLNRIRFLFIYLKALKNKDYDFRNFSCKFNSVIPSDDLVMSQILSQIGLGEKLSLKTGLQQLSFVESSDTEIKQLKAEQEEMLQGQSILNNLGDENGTE